ncbi:MAG: hypothetical protein PHD65_05965 [Gallionella sp.]|nr:hypothetical protein [Gallionella sp.]
MNDAVQETELSELERLEFNRRSDVAYAVVPAAVRLFSERAKLEERIKRTSKIARSYWYWIVIAGGVVLNYFLSDEGHKITWGTGVALLTIFMWYSKQYELGQLESQRDKYNGRLYEMEVIWNGATGSHITFWDINRFAGEFGFDREAEVFCDWWTTQSTSILARVCERGTAEKIVEELAKRQAKLREDLRDFRIIR